MSIRRLRLFLDANVIHAAALRDFLLRCAEAGLVDRRWSGPVLEETRRSLEGRGLPGDKIERLIRTLRLAFPEAEVDDFAHLIDRMDCPDPEDRHVLAAAVASEADVLVTDDIGGFPQDADQRHDLALVTGDDAAACLVRAHPDEAARIIHQQIADLTEGIWDATTGRGLRHLIGQQSGLRDAAFSPDGS